MKIKYPSFKEVSEINRYITTGEGNISKEQKLAIDKMNAELKPRDPARIDTILAVLGELWKLQPDTRLGQLLLNFAFRGGDYKEKTNYLMYEQEDNITLENLLKKLESEKTSKS